MSKKRLLLLVVLMISLGAAFQFFLGSFEDTSNYLENGNDASTISSSKDEIFIYRTFDKLCKEQNIEPPIWDDMLISAARPLVEKLADNKMDEQSDFQNAEISEAMTDHGVVDSSFRAHAASMLKIKETKKIIIDQKLVKEYADGRYTHMGVAVASRLWPPAKYMLILFSRRTVLLKPFPRTIDAQQEHILAGSIVINTDDLEILVSDPLGRIKTFSPKISADGSFSQALSFNRGGGTYTVEVQINGESGPEIAALFGVFSSEAPLNGTPALSPETVRHMPPIQTVFSAELRMFNLINQARQKAGKVHLARADDLDSIAREYAREMIENNHVAHISQEGLDIADRVTKAGIKYRFVAENIAVNQTIFDAHRNLMRSPAHAQMVLDNRFYEVGVGVAFKKSKIGSSVYIVQIFIQRL